jgi:excisionase family DNA binding protein
MERRSNIASITALEPAGRNGDRSVRRLMNAGEVAELLGVPRSWVYEQSRRGRIPTVSLERYRRYRREAIEAWIAEIEGGAAGRFTASRADGSRR